MSVVEKAIAKLLSASGEANAKGPARVAAGPVTLAAKPAPGPASAPRTLALDYASLREAGFSPLAADERRLADEFRRIKRPILDRVQVLIAAKHAGARLVMMASALPGDGKTFSSINLAFSIARERDVSVLLVDADVAKPHISRVLGVDRVPGLLDALSDHSLAVESLVLHTDLPGLSILPAGQHSEAATELLVSSRMAAVMESLSSSDPSRVVLFDSPPLLLSSESRALAQSVGQVVLMVRAGSTPQGAVIEAIGHVGAEKLTGLVLNQSEMKASNSHYGYNGYGDDYHAPAD